MTDKNLLYILEKDDPESDDWVNEASDLEDEDIVEKVHPECYIIESDKYNTNLNKYCWFHWKLWMPKVSRE